MHVEQTVADIVEEKPSRSRIFEQLGINYCCGGNRPLTEACTERGIDPERLIEAIEQIEAEEEAPSANELAKYPLADVISHIQNRHHAFLKQELPRLRQLVSKVAEGHGEDDPRLKDVWSEFEELASDLAAHVEREDKEFYPAILQGTATNPQQFVAELKAHYESSADRFRKISKLTDGYVPAEWACNSIRAMFDALSQLEHDTELHFQAEHAGVIGKLEQAS
jgi:regulator of cell morphogenesis and NO signaling